MTKSKGGAFMAKKDEMVQIDLNAQAKEILERAQAKGAENSFMFLTTFQRYKEQLSHLVELEKIIKAEGLLVEKEYVKGRKNLYMNPAIAAYNSTAQAADKTAQLLIRYIVNPLKDDDEEKDSFDLF